MSNQSLVSFSFKDQLVVGDRGEELFQQYYPTKIELYPGREYDFTCVTTGAKIELKTDTYSLFKTENFFMERYSDINREDKPGGPWRALQDKIDLFCYMFVRENVYFQFEVTQKLIDRLDNYTEKKGLVYIKNKGWITGGYKVPRKIIEEFYIARGFVHGGIDGVANLVKLIDGGK